MGTSTYPALVLHLSLIHILEVMKKVADKHGLVCLLHEKPFEGINGSGKHNNWSMITDTGVNILDPGKTPAENTQFLISVSYTHLSFITFTALTCIGFSMEVVHGDCQCLMCFL